MEAGALAGYKAQATARAACSGAAGAAAAEAGAVERAVEQRQQLWPAGEVEVERRAATKAPAAGARAARWDAEARTAAV